MTDSGLTRFSRNQSLVLWITILMMSGNNLVKVVAVPRETFPGERCVALVPAVVPALTKAGLEVHIQMGAGVEAGFHDEQYSEMGATIDPDRPHLFNIADVVLQVRAYGADRLAGPTDLDLMRNGQVVIGLADPLGEPHLASRFADMGVTLFALELIPRITRAQSMDVLTSMAMISGYKAALMAAGRLPKMFPLMMTAAGTIRAARVLVIGAGVAGLHAIATARRLGAVVEAYDVRPVAKEQVESLGAKFVELDLGSIQSQDRGGYAKPMSEDFYHRQRQLLLEVIRKCDVVITTAAVPGKRAPVLVTRDMVAEMAFGSVIVDLAAPQGGNCELSQPGQDIVGHGVTVMGPTNLPSTIPYHASQMYAKNISTFLMHLISEGRLNFDLEDPIVCETLVTRAGQVVHPRVRESLGLDNPKLKEPCDG